MGKLRHIAIQVPDLEKAAAFYEGVFGLKRLKKVDAPIGKCHLAVRRCDEPHAAAFPRRTKGGKGGPDWAGLHRFGFVVENENATEQEIKKHGGEFFMQLPNYPGVDAWMSDHSRKNAENDGMRLHREKCKHYRRIVGSECTEVVPTSSSDRAVVYPGSCQIECMMIECQAPAGCTHHDPVFSGSCSRPCGSAQASGIV